MKLFQVTYLKYSDTKQVLVCARTVRMALDKAEAYVKKNYADRVTNITEMHKDIELAK